MSDPSDVPSPPRSSVLTEQFRRCLAPVMRVWRAGIKQTLAQVPRPADAPRASAPGPDSARVLIFGAGLAVGWGVVTHDLALPGFLARTLSSLTGRGVDVDLVAHPDIHSGEALRRLKALPLWRYDAIVVVLGVNESLYLASSKAWGRDLTTLFSQLQETIDIPVVLTGIQKIRSIPAYDSFLGSIADVHATRLNQVSTRVCAAAANAIFVPLPNFAITTLHRHRGPDTFAESARGIAEALSPVLSTPQHQSSDCYPPPQYDNEEAEGERQAAVDTLDLANPELGPVVDQILDIARLSLTARAAVFTVLDRERQVFRARGWSAPAEAPRVGSMCEATIRQWGGMTVADARDDERFRDNALVTGEPHVRFYAGYPVESASGERIGALCVFDTAPHAPTHSELATLRNLTLDLQRALNRVH